MIQFSDIPGSKKAMNARMNVPIGVVEALIDLLMAARFNVGGAYLNPYGVGAAHQLVPVAQIADLPRNEAFAYQVQVNGTMIQAAMLWRNVQLLGETLAFQMLTDELKYGS